VEDSPSAADVIVDMPSIINIRKHMYRRWIPFYATLVLKFVPLAGLSGFGLFWLLRWLHPDSHDFSPWILVLGFAVAAFFICLLTLPAMLRLDSRIIKALDHMAARVAAGETVYASEIGASMERPRKK
jgi:hypothetical protein